MGANTHRFDKWMVKFLTAHALTLEDKSEDGFESGPMHDVSEHEQLERNRIAQNLMMEIQDQEFAAELVQ